MKKTELFSTLPFCALFLLLFLSGCANMYDRREARWAAFEPLRPDPQYRLLPDKPILFRPDRSGRPDPVPVTEILREPPVIWTAHRLEKNGLNPGVTRFHDTTAEVYFTAALPFCGELVAKAVDSSGNEIGRVRVPAEFRKGDARFVAFAFSGNFTMNQIKVVSVDLMDAGE